MIVMNKVGPQKEAAKAFLLFIHQRSQLAKATLISNSPRPYDFVATEEELQAYGTPFMAGRDRNDHFRYRGFGI